MSRSDGLVRDVDGALIDPTPAPVCDRDDCTGWTGEDHRGRPRPCRTHRADLAQRVARQRRRTYAGVR